MKKLIQTVGVMFFVVSMFSTSILHCLFSISQPYPSLIGPYAVGTTTTRLLTHDRPAIARTWYYPSSIEKEASI